MLYQIENTEFHGKAMVATQDIQPGPEGFTILKEDAILRMPPAGTNGDMSGTPPSILDKFDPQIWTDWFIFRQQPIEVKSKILDMYHEMDCRHAVWLRNYLDKKKEELQQQRHADDGDDEGEEKLDSCQNDHDHSDEEFSKLILDHVDEFIRFTMVVRFNSANLMPAAEDGNGPGPDMGHGLFVQAGKLTHSCRPNCSWYTTSDGKGKVIRAIQPISKGEELTVDYLGGELFPLPQRRKDLLDSKGFLCHCTRCEESAQGGDDTRRFQCFSTSKMNDDSKEGIPTASSSCGGVHFLIQPLASSKPELTACTGCHQVAPQEYVDHCCDMEIALSEELKELDLIMERNNNVIYDGQEEEKQQEQKEKEIIDVSHRIEQLEPPHRLHCLASKIYAMKGNQYLQQGEYQRAADAFTKQVECRTAILGTTNKNDTTAWCVERVGDALRHVNLDEATDAYKETIRTLKFTRGKSDPYCSCAIHKLAEVQHRQQSHYQPTN